MAGWLDASSSCAIYRPATALWLCSWSGNVEISRQNQFSFTRNARLEKENLVFQMRPKSRQPGQAATHRAKDDQARG